LREAKLIHFSTQRYYSAVYAVVYVWLSVRLSQVGVLLKTVTAKHSITQPMPRHDSLYGLLVFWR